MTAPSPCPICRADRYWGASSLGGNYSDSFAVPYCPNCGESAASRYDWHTAFKVDVPPCFSIGDSVE